MAPNDRARAAHDRLFPGHVSTLAGTDPDLIETFDNFAFDEVLAQGSLDERTRLIVTLGALVACQALAEYRVMLGAALLAAKQMGVERIIIMSRHETRQNLALEFGATDIVSERGDAGVARIRALTKTVGADSVLECVGTKESMAQALHCARPGAMVGYVGVPHGVELSGQELFYGQVGMLGGPAPVRRFLPHLIDLVLTRKIDPGKIFDLELPLADVAEGYEAMDERRAIKVMLRM